MCEFFSFITEPTYHPGQKFYFDWNYRKENLNKNCDSHSMIAKFFELKEDYCNKYEFNPLTKEFKIDQINNSEDDSLIVEEWVNKLNFKKIVKPLILKPIIHPFELPKAEITELEIKLLKEWDSVWNSVGNSVGDSVWDSVWNSVGDSVGNSVGNSVDAYLSSFFNIKYQYDFSSSIKLWEKGIVPSFDGKIWRLHSGKNAEIVFEITKQDLENYKI